MPAAGSSEGLAEALLELQQLTERLRRDCPWDREQTAVTIVPHTVEEAYEVADAALAGGRRRSCSTSSAIFSSRSTSSRYCSRSGATVISRRSRGPCTRSSSGATRTCSGTSKRVLPTACARTGSASSASRRGAKASSTTSPRGCRGCSMRGRSSSARRRSASSTRTRRRARRPHRRAARARGGAVGRRARRRPLRGSQRRAQARGRPRARAAPRGAALPPPGRGGRGAGGGGGENWSELPLERQDE